MVKSAVSLDDTSPALLWLVVEPPTPLKNDGLKVSWDDFPFPINRESHLNFHGSSHHQAVKKKTVFNLTMVNLTLLSPVNLIIIHHGYER